MESANLTDMNIDKIAALFPNCITETADENGKLKDLRKTLEKDSFFIKNNNVTLSGAGPLNNIAALDVKISEIEDQIKQTPAFQEIEKMLSDAKGMVLKDIIETHPDIVEYLAIKTNMQS